MPIIFYKVLTPFLQMIIYSFFMTEPLLFKYIMSIRRYTLKEMLLFFFFLIYYQIFLFFDNSLFLLLFYFIFSLSTVYNTYIYI